MRVLLTEHQQPYLLSKCFLSAGPQTNKPGLCAKEGHSLTGTGGYEVTVHMLIASPDRGATEAVESQGEDLTQPPKVLQLNFTEQAETG